MHSQQSLNLNKLLTKPNGEFARKYEKFVEKNGHKSIDVNNNNFTLLLLLGVNLYKKHMKEFPKLAFIGKTILIDFI